ncbi:MAG: hypothetical protein GXY83_29530 [Rhodopirellula sp.]|nr:hypothetical protein [Rhodopirellula sp.]
MMARRMLSAAFFPWFVVALAALSDGLATAVEADALRQEVERWIRDLDSDQFAIREVAALELEQLALRSEPKALAEQIERVLLQPKLSFEVRMRLERLAQTLPPPAQPNVTSTEEEIDTLVDQLECDKYAERLGAARRLDRLMSRPELVCPIMIRLKARRLDDRLSPDARLWVEPLDQEARLAWLNSDPATWQLPPVSDAQMEKWIDVLTKQASDESQAHRSAQATARRELLDLLARDEYVKKITPLLEATLAGPNLDPLAEKRLREILDLTQPAMVAEFWTDRQHLGTQYLLVGVPSLGPGAERPSHFDRIDDSVAHCVSGNSLMPGDYAVGVAIPHPKQENAIFHLVNLPTPRRRMAYDYRRQTDAASRLADLTRRTTERFLREKRRLVEAELNMLPQLDVELASAFAARLLLTTEDQRMPEESSQRTAGRPSHHGILCVFLATEGTNSAADALLEAIQSDRVLPPTPAAPYRLDWVAALSIAVADPWPDASTWLAGLIHRADPLILDRADSSELGATAAAILLEKHQQAPLAFGLQPSGDRVLDVFGIPGCRFNSSEAGDNVLRWWNQRKGEAAVGLETSP